MILMAVAADMIGSLIIENKNKNKTKQNNNNNNKYDIPASSSSFIS